MEINLKYIPKNPTVIEGFPGFGLVGSVATEFLVNHLETEHIGSVYFSGLPAMIAIHDKQIVEPISLHYNKQNNILIFNIVTVSKGIEWELADAIARVVQEVKASRLICLEGVNSNADTDKPNVFFYSNKDVPDFGQSTVLPMTEGIIMGATSALMLKLKDEVPMLCLFAETHSNMPDSRASAELIKILDKYLKLDVDYNPLLQTAVKMEEKIKGIINKSSDMQREQQMKNLSYLG